MIELTRARVCFERPEVRRGRICMLLARLLQSRNAQTQSWPNLAPSKRNSGATQARRACGGAQFESRVNGGEPPPVSICQIDQTRPPNLTSESRQRKHVSLARQARAERPPAKLKPAPTTTGPPPCARSSRGRPLIGPVASTGTAGIQIEAR